MSIIDRMAESAVGNVTLLAVNTDVQALVDIEADLKILLDEKTGGRGTGGLPQVGEEAALRERETITEAVTDTYLVFIAAGLGGGTGTGATPVTAKVAQEEGALAIPIVTMPFSAEGEVRRKNAAAGLERLHDLADIVIPLQSDRLLRLEDVERGPTAFEVNDQTIEYTVNAITTLVNSQGNVNVTYSDVRTVFEKVGRTTVAFGETAVDRSQADAAASALKHPLFEENKLSTADSVLVGVFCDRPTSMDEVAPILNKIEAAVSDEARIVYGTAVDEELSDTTRTMIVATPVDSLDDPAQPQSESEIQLDNIDQI